MPAPVTLPPGRPRKGGTEGFTLLELLLSITILAVVAAMILGAFRVSYRAWEKGEAAVEAAGRLRSVQERIRRQLAAIVAMPGARPRGEDGPDLRFGGSRSALRFVSEAPLVPGLRRDRVWVHYRVFEEADGGLRLAFHEIPQVLLDPEGDNEPAEDRFYDLLTGLAAVEFEYFTSDEPDSPPRWVASWDPEDDTGLPRAVRMKIRTSPGEPETVVLARLPGPGGLEAALPEWLNDEP